MERTGPTGMFTQLMAARANRQMEESRGPAFLNAFHRTRDRHMAMKLWPLASSEGLSFNSINSCMLVNKARQVRKSETANSDPSLWSIILEEVNARRTPKRPGLCCYAKENKHIRLKRCKSQSLPSSLSLTYCSIADPALFQSLQTWYQADWLSPSPAAPCSRTCRVPKAASAH